MNIYSQVVIKDEIVLDEITPDAVTSSTLTPAYGKLDLWYAINSSYTCTKVTAQIGDLTVNVRGWNFTCPCNGGGIGDGEHMFWYDIPAGTPISMEILTCINEEWVNCPVSFGPWEQDGDFYNLDYTVQYGGNNIDIAKENNNLISNSLRVWAYDPPGNCPNARGNYCDNSGWVQVPEINSAHYSISLVISKECSKHPNTIAAFGPAFDHRSNLNMVEMSPSNVIACYIQIAETWQFNLDQNVKAYYQIGICSTHVSNRNLTYINNITDIENIPSDKCLIALESFKAHKEYKYDIGLDIPNGGYLITPVILLHEEGHRDRWQKFMDDYFFIWENGILNFRVDCEEYANIFEARKGGLNMYARKFNDYWVEAFKYYQKYTGLDPYNKEIRYEEEKKVNSRPEVQNLIEIYINRLKEHCGIN